MAPRKEEGWYYLLFIVHSTSFSYICVIINRLNSSPLGEAGRGINYQHMNDSQKIFVAEYLRHNDKKKAYRTAYPNAKESSLTNAANRLLKHPEVAAKVAKKHANAMRRADRKLEFEYMDILEAKRALTLTVRGELEMEKAWHTKDGLDRHMIKPTHNNILSAIEKYAKMEGWYVRSAGAGSERAEKTEEEKIKDLWKSKEKPTFTISIDGFSMEEWGKLHRGETDAYFDKEDGTAKYWPVDDCMHIDRVMEIQKRREKRKDAEREARMTAELIREEKLAIKEWETRPVDDGLYEACDKVIKRIREEYIKDKKPEQLTELKAVEKMCGLRFLHHRHRYEAENTAGWEFHPLNTKLIREKITSKPQQLTTTFQSPNPSVQISKEGAPESELMSVPLDQNPSEGVTAPTHQTSLRGGTTKQPSHAPDGNTHDKSVAGLDCFVPHKDASGVSSGGEKERSEAVKRVDYTGWFPIKDLVREMWDKYIWNQHSGTYRAYNNILKMRRSIQLDPHLRQKIEDETGWQYHPQDPRYARRLRRA